MSKTSKESLEGLLAAADETPPAEWARVREELGAKARRKGLVDISYEMHDTPFGPLLVAATEQGLVRVGLSAENPEAILDDMSRRISPRILAGSRPQIKRARKQLDQYLNGKRREFDLDLDRQLTGGFRRLVLDATEGIPFGQTRSYREIATEAGSRNAVRAAGSALAHNPLPIVIPCHRVLKTDGKVGKYLGGTAMKEQLLEMERGPA